MREIHKVLATVPYQKEKRKIMEKAFAPAEVCWVNKEDKEKISEVLKEADTAVLGSDITPQILQEGVHLKWIHCDHAGLNASAKPEVFARNIVLSGSAGRSGPVLAEHIFFLTLSLIYDSHGLLKQQEQKTWGGIPGYQDRRGLYGKTMGIIGMGYTGQETAKRAKAFGMTVLGYGRSKGVLNSGSGNSSEKEETSHFVDKMYYQSEGDGIEALLAESDVVVLSIRLSDETYHMIDADALKTMKSTAYLINMARGAVVDEAALAEALKNGEIAGAGCDTFECEPLPVGSPLWNLPNMIITPHCTPEMPDLEARSLEIICENVERFQEGKTLKNQLTVRDVYTKG